MHRISVSLLILGLVSEHGLAQRTDTSAVFRKVANSSSPVAAKREAERLRRRADFIPATTLNDKASYLMDKKAMGQTVQTSGDEQTTYLLVHRTASSDPEVHARWDDLVIVRSGSGVIELGDSLVGSKYLGPGERRGGKYNKSYQIVVHAGDLLRIPAAVPHSFLVSGSVPLEYLVVKQRRQDLPIRWYGER
jgi:mannose-6-phosphate isomerase-like protein (cupin superfamily)